MPRMYRQFSVWDGFELVDPEEIADDGIDDDMVDAVESMDTGSSDDDFESTSDEGMQETILGIEDGEDEATLNRRLSGVPLKNLLHPLVLVSPAVAGEPRSWGEFVNENGACLIGLILASLILSGTLLFFLIVYS